MGKRVKKAVSPGHKLGQLIGNFFEAALAPHLQKLANRKKLYLDRRGPRQAVRGDKTKVSWTDNRGNSHDLDYVIERGGSATQQGRPVAFIEIAWRRYTKHSRNKTGEIEGSLLHLRDSYRTCCFVGAVLAGEYTLGGIRQLASHGITVLQVPFQAVIDAFLTQDIDLGYAERASATIKRNLIRQLQALKPEQIVEIAAAFEKSIKTQLAAFLQAIEVSVSREIAEVVVIGMFGGTIVARSLALAVEAVNRFDEAHHHSLKFERYELIVRFRDGSEIDGKFANKQSAVQFLDSLQS